MNNTVLIVDDIADNINVVANILMSNNINVGIAQNGKDALIYAKNKLPDLILLDIMMPEMTGFEVCKKLKSDNDTKDIPVIFLTAKDDNKSIIEGFNKGAVDYIYKPFYEGELIARVKTHLELKKSKSELEYAQNNLKNILNNVADAIFIHDFKGSILKTNQTFNKRFGYTKEELLSKNVKIISTPENFKNFDSDIDQIKKNGKISFETILKSRTNKFIPSEVLVTLINYEGEMVCLGVARDITVRLKNRQKLIVAKKKAENNEKKLKEAQKIAQLGNWELDILNNKLTWSDEIYRIFGLKPQEFEGTYEAFLENIHPDDRDFVNNAYTNSLKNKKKYEIEHRLLLKSGELKYVKEKCKTEYNESGKAIYSYGIVIDITKEKLADLEIKKLSVAVEQSPATIVITDLEGNIEYANPSFTKLSGYTLEEALGKNPRILKSERTNTETYLDLWKTIKCGNVWKGEFINKKKNGKEFIEKAIIAPIKNQKGDIINYMAIKTDITKQKIAELTLKNSEEKLQTIIETVTEGITLSDISGYFEIFNSKMEEITEYSIQEANETDLFINKLYPSRKKNITVSKRLKKLQKSGGINEEETEIVSKSGNVKTLLVSTSIIKHNKKEYFLSAYRDITARKKAQLALQESEDKYRMIIESTTDVIVIVDKFGKILFVNERQEKLSSRKKHEVIGKNFSDFVPKKEIPKYFLQIKNILIRKEIKNFESFIIDKNERTIPVEMSGRVVKQKGKTVILTSMRDISYRKKSEEALKESEAKFKVISSSANDAIILMDNSGNAAFWNDAAEKIFGYSQKEILNKSIHNILPISKYQDSAIKAFAAFKETGKGNAVNKTIEVEAKRKNGENFPIELSLSAIKIKGLWNAIGIVKDITERKKAEKILKESEEKLKKAQKIAQMGNWEFAFENQKIFFSEELVEIFELEEDQHSFYEFSEKLIYDDEKEKFLSIINDHFAGEIRKENEYRILVSNENIKYISLISEAFFDNENKIIKLSGTIQDITHLKEIQIQLERHKNNLEELIIERTNELRISETNF